MISICQVVTEALFGDKNKKNKFFDKATKTAVVGGGVTGGLGAGYFGAQTADEIYSDYRNARDNLKNPKLFKQKYIEYVRDFENQQRKAKFIKDPVERDGIITSKMMNPEEFKKNVLEPEYERAKSVSIPRIIDTFKRKIDADPEIAKVAALGTGVAALGLAARKLFKKKK